MADAGSRVRNASAQLSVDPLKDSQLRHAFEDYLQRRSPRPAAILHELRVSRGNAVADVVALFRNPHCFEIKGQTDSVRRVLRQSSYYSLSFRRLTLITTRNHERWAMKNLPDCWGLIVAAQRPCGISFHHVRPATFNRDFCPEVAFALLWREELSTLVSARQPGAVRTAHTRADLARMAATLYSTLEVPREISRCLSERRAAKPINHEG